MREFIYDLKNFLTEHIKVVMPVALILAVVLTVGISVTARRHKKAELKAEQDAVVDVIEDVPLEEDAYPEVNKLFNTYYSAMAAGDTDAIESISSELGEEEKIRISVISQYIDEYPEMHVYTKPGNKEGTWIAFVYSKLKFIDQSYEVPGMQAMYVCTRDDGSLYINTDDEQDSEDTDYIQAVSVQDDVVDLNNKVAAEYNDLLAGNPDLTQFLDELSGEIDLQVGQQLGALEALNGSTQTGDTVGDSVFLRANDIVNIRDSASEDGKIIGQTNVNDVYQLISEDGSGWSKITFSGKSGYVKSDYFTKVSADGSEIGSEDSGSDQSEESAESDAEAAEESEGEDAGEESADGDSEAATQYTKAKSNDTVKVRKSASTDAQALGTVYPGDTLEVVEYSKDGWSKVKFDDDIGYVKSEFFTFE